MTDTVFLFLFDIENIPGISLVVCIKTIASSPILFSTTLCMHGPWMFICIEIYGIDRFTIRLE